MSPNSFTNNQWLSRILLIAIIIFSAVIMYAVNGIDQIVNVQLYEYQLQPNDNWLNPYHSFAYLIYAGLGASILISGILLLLGFVKNKEPTPAPMDFKSEIPETKPATQPVQTEPKPVITKPKTQPTPPPTPKIENTQPIEPKLKPTPTSTPKIATVQPKPEPKPETITPTITEEKKTKTIDKPEKTKTSANACPSCKKTFTQPLVMLDFEGGKSKLVNVCPYCNQVLGDTEQTSQ